MKDKFISELKSELNLLKCDDVDDVISYFDELIEDKKADGLNEEDIIKALGDVRDIAKKLCQDRVDDFTYEEVNIEDEIDDDKMYTERFSIEDVKVINFDNQYNELTIKKSSSNNVIFKHSKSDNYKYDISLDDGVLDIEYENFISISFGKNINRLKTKNILYIPDNTYLELNIDSVSGKVIINNLKLKELNIDDVSGDIEIDNLECHELNIDDVSGNLNLDYIKVNELNLETISGRINAYDLKSDFINIETVSGNMNLDIDGYEDDYHIKLESIKKEYENHKELKKIKSINLETVSGSIKYNFK